MTILEQIVGHKKKEVAIQLADMASETWHRRPTDSRKPLDFKEALRKTGLSIIAEVKKASPSKGLIRPDFDPVAIARSYEAFGCSAISVLTEQRYFQGHNEDLVAIRQKVTVPLLRKDFMVDLRQVREAYDMGADAILLIMAVLSPEETRRFLSLAKEFELAALVEVHTLNELETALSLDCDIIGINNRNLSDFTTDIRHSLVLRERIPAGIVCISESGIRDAADCRLLYQAGFDAVLVGEILMRQTIPGSSIPEFRVGS